MSLRRSFCHFAALVVSAVLLLSCDTNEVEPTVYEIEGVSLDIDEAELIPGDSIVLTASLLPYNKSVSEAISDDNSLADNIFWKSDNRNVADVDANGVVHATGVGSCNISFICGTFGARCHITVRSFNLNIMYGLWEVDDVKDHYFFGFDGDGYKNEDTFEWKFDGMRLSMSGNGSEKLMIITSVSGGKIHFYFKDDQERNSFSLNRIPLVISPDEIERVQIDKPVPGDSTVSVVDMGLPSGLLWASCNLGAAAPQEDGLRYAWAETAPKKSYTLDNYLWYDQSKHVLTKYTDNSINTMEADDNAVALSLGGQWSIPSADDVRELFDNCNMLYCSLSGREGFLLVPKADTQGRLFLPFSLSSNLLSVSSGSQQGSSPFEKFGYFWTSTLSDVDPMEAYSFCINMDENVVDLYHGMGKSGRYYGLCIRPVFDEKK